MKGGEYMDIGSVLRESRLNAKMSVGQVSKILMEQGYKASQKTVYSWENGNSRPDIEILMKLCDIYDIKDILRTFGYDGYKEDGSLQLNMREVELVEKYRFISTYSPEGSSVVEMVLDRENSIAEKLKRQKEHIEKLKKDTLQNNRSIPNTRLINYYFRLASAGTGQIVFDMPPTEKIEIPAIPEYRKVDYAIGVNGNSMQPEYNDGDILLIEMTEEIEPGEIGIFIVNGESFVKKLGDKELISLNPDYGNISLTEDSKCRGRVVGKL